MPLTSLRSTARRILNRATFASWKLSGAGRQSQEGLAALHGKHKGRRCFIIGNGPSLNKTPIERMASEVTIGCNGIFLLFERMGYQPTYYTVEDVLVAKDRREEIGRIQGSTRVFPFDLKGLLLPGQQALWVQFIRKYSDFPRFTDDFVREAYWGGTVTYLNLQLAVHLGCNPIYLVGIDHNYKTDVPVKKEGSVWTSQADDPNHFDPNYFGKGYRWHDPNVERMEQAYVKAREYAKARGIQILNATVGGKLEVFPRVDITTLLV